VPRTKSNAEDLLLAHVLLFSSEVPSESPEGRVAERVEPALVALLMRALRSREAPPRGALRL
jgi:hypothetical protein